MPHAIEVCKEAAELGYESAIHNLQIFLSDYAFWLFRGENGIEQNLTKAVEVCREAAGLGDEAAKKNLPKMFAFAQKKGLI